MAKFIRPRRSARRTVLPVLAGSVALLWSDDELPAGSGESSAVAETAETTADAQVAALCARAERWMSLRQTDLAIVSYRDAAELYPDAFAARFGLAKALWAKGRSEEALVEVAQAERTARHPHDRAAAFMMEATIRLDKGELEAAEQAVETAFAVAPEPLDLPWYLKRVYIQRRLGHFDACLQGLEEGRIRTGSPILKALWVDALIDAGEVERALKEIDLHLRQEEVEVRSGWRLRKARALLAKGRRRAAEEELHLALTELETRIQPEAEYPDIALYLERGSALALLGREEEARRDLETAKEAGADDAMLWRLRRELGN